MPKAQNDRPKPASKRVVIVVSYRFDVVGGHLLSAAAIAQELKRCGYEVGILVHPTGISDLDRPEFITHGCPYLDGIGGPIRRSWDILRITATHGYDILVTMDGKAADQAALAAVIRRPYLIQVQPGGPLRPLPPLNLPGIVVFSEELLVALHTVQRIPAQYLVLSRGRVDFAQARQDADAARSTIPIHEPRPVVRILTSSRLHEDKARAIEALFEQAALAARNQPLEIWIIGDGDARGRLEAYAGRIVSESAQPLTIRFLGAWRVSARDILQADLIVGQGNTVIESIAWGVPAAVCGADGYFGVLTRDSLPALARTNLTGRGIACHADLLTDLHTLPTYVEQEFPAVRSACAAIYDVHCAVDGIETALTRIMTENKGASVSRPKLARAYCAQALMYLAYRARRWWAAAKPNLAASV